jgi:hypothetical protein
MGKPIAPAQGIAFAFPDVCLTPSPGGPVPVPYPNIADLSQAQPVSDAAGKELLVGPSSLPVVLQSSTVPTSSGDEGGSAGGGTTTGTIKGPCEVAQGSGSVLYGAQGLGIARFGDPTDHNKSGPAANASGTILATFPTVLVGD